jgi:surfactin synthase thioesterase subunit
MTGLLSVSPAARSDAAVLLCLPQAGAGAGQFQPWQRLAGAGVLVVGVQLPGREGRWREPPAMSMGEIVNGTVAELATAGARPLVVYGQSFGGLLGYEVARRLGQLCGMWPRALVVAACRPPNRWVGAGRALFNDEAELSRLLAGGLDASELDEDSRALMLDTLRQDARLSMSFTLAADPVLHCPIHAWGGSCDQTVTSEQLDEWSRFSSIGLHRATFPGGHQFAAQHTEQVVARLVSLTKPVAEEEPR